MDFISAQKIIANYLTNKIAQDWALWKWAQAWQISFTIENDWSVIFKLTNEQCKHLKMKYNSFSFQNLKNQTSEQAIRLWSKQVYRKMQVLVADHLLKNQTKFQCERKK